MNPKFANLVDQLEPALQRLLSMQPCRPLELPDNIPAAGVYVLSDASGPLYVGRTNKMRKRLGNHCRVGATGRMAAFAFRLAREATGHTKPAYGAKGSKGTREYLMRDPIFVRAFEDAKARIRSMDVRFVEEANPVRQCLLEVYVHVALATPHNDFDNH